MLGTGDKDHGWRGEQGGALISLNTHQAQPRTLPTSFMGREHLLALFMGEGTHEVGLSPPQTCSCTGLSPTLPMVVVGGGPRGPEEQK